MAGRPADDVAAETADGAKASGVVRPRRLELNGLRTDAARAQLVAGRRGALKYTNSMMATKMRKPQIRPEKQTVGNM